jgi:hypothetical protein
MNTNKNMILATYVGHGLDAKSWQLLKELGFTIFQTDSDHLSTNETAPGQWDWTNFDQALAQTRAQGVEWMFFPHFAFPPPWFRQQDSFTRLQCLEHRQTVEAFSIWDPRALAFLDQGYRALAGHYRGLERDIHAFYLGVHGDYGECMFPAACRLGTDGQRQDWQKRFGDLHNHTGYWCGDDLAPAAFREAMLAKYGSLAALNRAWGCELAAEEAIAFPATPARRRAWLDFIRWYLDSMVAYAAEVARAANRYFPKSLKMFPLGAGDEDPRVGQDNSALVKMARREGVQIRSTHGGFRPFAANAASQLARIASACKHCGVPFWSEPPGTITPAGEVSRIFESICCGATGFWDWTGNPLQPEAREVFRKYRHLLAVDRPVVQVALLYPQTDHYLHPESGFPARFLEWGAELRDLVHFDILDEALIADNALAPYRFLIHLAGTVFERRTLERISAWVEVGGVFCVCDPASIETVEGDGKLLKELMNGAASETGVIRKVGRGAFCAGRSAGDGKERYFSMLRDVLYLDPPGASREPVPSVDREFDGVYGVVLASGRALLHNPSAEQKEKTVAGRKYQLPPASIVEVERYNVSDK